MEFLIASTGTKIFFVAIVIVVLCLMWAVGMKDHTGKMPKTPVYLGLLPAIYSSVYLFVAFTTPMPPHEHELSPNAQTLQAIMANRPVSLASVYQLTDCGNDSAVKLAAVELRWDNEMTRKAAEVVYDNNNLLVVYASDLTTSPSTKKR